MITSNAIDRPQYLHLLEIHVLSAAPAVAVALAVAVDWLWPWLSSSGLIFMKSKIEALESVMCDVIKIRLKRRDATRSKIK